MKSFGCMPAVRTPEASRTLTVSCPGILPSPLRDKVGAFHHDRFRGYVSVHFRSGLHPPCLRFAVAVAGHHARLGTRLLVRLCRGRHRRRLNSMRLQGATLTGRVEDWRAGLGRRFRPRHVSSPLRVERSVRISRTALPHLLCVEAYWTYPAGATFGPSRRTR